MATLRVWAPRAGAVEVELSGRRVPMDAAERGWHEADVEAGPGDRYAFSLDGGPPRPDPRSPWQPEGVHGPSAIVDQTAFAWTDQSWTGFDLTRAVLYELHIGTFSPEGTFDGAISRLDHLVRLGVTAVELLPVAQFDGTRGWGYDGVALYAPHESYGGPDGLRRLVDACHARGLGVVLDVVYNHLGPAGNYLPEFGPYFTDRFATPWGQAVNLDGPGSDEVRRFFLDNAAMWLRDYHVDGLRLDAVHALLDTSAVHLLEQMAVEVEDLGRQLGRQVHLIAESDLNDPRVVWPRPRGGYGIDAQWSDDFHHALHAWLTGESSGYYADFTGVDDVATALRDAFVYAGRYSAHRDRVHGRPIEDAPGWRFLGYLQNHDQVGNRARGERSSHLLSQGRLKIAAVLVLTGPFVPLLFQGEEWGASAPFQYFTDHQDPELGRAVAAGRRAEFASFGWAPHDVPDPQDQATFERSRLRWDERDEPGHAELLAWHQALIALRAATPDLRDGDLSKVDVDWDASGGWLVLRRGSITVAANAGDAELALDIDGEALLVSGPDVVAEDGRLVLPPDSVAVLRAGTR